MERPPDARAGFLAACGSDDDLRREVESQQRFWPAAWSSDGRKMIAGVMSPGSLPILALYSIETGQLEKISNYGFASGAWLYYILESVEADVWLLNHK